MQYRCPLCKVVMTARKPENHSKACTEYRPPEPGLMEKLLLQQEKTS